MAVTAPGAVPWGELVVTAWSQDAEVYPGAVVALALDSGAAAWVSEWTPSDISAPVVVRGETLLQWAGPSMSGQMAELAELNAANGSIVGGVLFCDDCSGYLDADAGLLWFYDAFG